MWGLNSIVMKYNKWMEYGVRLKYKDHWQRTQCFRYDGRVSGNAILGGR